jgi:predicted metal-dependent hydrolase
MRNIFRKRKDEATEKEEIRKQIQQKLRKRILQCKTSQQARQAFLEYQKEIKQKLGEEWTIIEVKREQKPEYIA